MILKMIQHEAFNPHLHNNLKQTDLNEKKSFKFLSCLTVMGQELAAHQNIYPEPEMLDNFSALKNCR
jgi:hypothetical protein